MELPKEMLDKLEEIKQEKIPIEQHEKFDQYVKDLTTDPVRLREFYNKLKKKQNES